MTQQAMLTPYTAEEVEAAAALVAQRKAENDQALMGLAYAKAAAKETNEALAQAFVEWLKARASYLASEQTENTEGDDAEDPDADGLLYDDVRAAIRQDGAADPEAVASGSGRRRRGAE